MYRFVGKLVGAVLGFVLAGHIGAVLGLIIGHIHDRSAPPRSPELKRNIEGGYFPDFPMNRQQESVFSTSVIVLGAKLAKVDGHVSREEIMAFRRAFRTRDSKAAEVGHLFDKARASADGYEPHATRLAQLFGNRPEVLEQVLVGLFYIAIADSARLSRAELFFLKRVGVIFGFDETAFGTLAKRVGIQLESSPPPPKHDSAYEVLGLPTTASMDVIKRTYHALVRKHHPDKLLAAGLPAKQIAEATEKIKRINAAYSDICKQKRVK